VGAINSATMKLSYLLLSLFFDKEHILISRRYQLHPASATTHCPSGITDAHNQKRKKNYKNEKSRFSSTNTTKTALEVQLLQKRRLQEGNTAQAPSLPDHGS
jgi:hypothetical protein